MEDIREIDSNINQAKELEARFAETSVALRGKLADSRFEQARRRVAQWKEDVQTLRTLIAQQLQHCKSLRESSTLATMLTEEPQEVARKRTNTLVNELKADVRLLHDAIARNVLSAESQREGKEEVDLDGLHLRNVFEERSQLEQRTTILERRLKQYKTVPMGGKPMPLPALFDLFDLRHEMQEELSSHVLATKLALDTHMGAEEFNREADLPMLSSQASRCTMAYLNVVEAALQMTSLVRHARMVKDGVHRAEALAKLESEKDDLCHELNAAQRRVRFLEKTLESTKNSGEAVRGSGRDKILLDEAQHRIAKLEREFVAMRQRNVELSAQASHAEDAYSRLQSESEDQHRQHTRDTAWYGPRVEKLEQLVLRTASAFDAMALDIELISDMYRRVVAELEQHQTKTSALVDERDRLAAQLTRTIKKLSAAKLEGERRSKVSTAMMGARHEIMEENKALRAELKALKNEVKRREDSKRELEEMCRGVEAELREKKEALQSAEQDAVSLRKSERAMKSKLQRVEAEQIALEAAHEERINALKSAGIDAAMQEEFDEMRLRLDESMRAQGLLEGMLKKAEKNNDHLERQLADLRRSDGAKKK